MGRSRYSTSVVALVSWLAATGAAVDALDDLALTACST